MSGSDTIALVINRADAQRLFDIMEGVLINRMPVEKLIDALEILNGYENSYPSGTDMEDPLVDSDDNHGEV
jgi:hypothetical protein